MQGDNPVSWLMFFTLTATVFVIAGGFIAFLRSDEGAKLLRETGNLPGSP